MTMANNLEKIIEELWIVDQGPEGWKPKTEVIPLDQLRGWMKSDDIEVLGHIHTVLNDDRFRVHPPLFPEESRQFTMRYFERCLRENPEGEWSDNRYSAAWDIVQWFLRLWDDASLPRAVLAEIKHWLGSLYNEADEGLRKCIATATIEHLFERKEVRKFFADWENDPVLKAAYHEGMLWVTHGGSSPLSGNR